MRKVRLRLALALVKVGRKPVAQHVAAPSVLNRAPDVEQRLLRLGMALVDYQHTVPPRDTGQNGVDARKRKAMPHGAADDRLRIVFRQDGAKHVERTDVGRGLAAPVRVRREDELPK